MERMIDFNPEEETITIPTPQTAGLNACLLYTSPEGTVHSELLRRPGKLYVLASHFHRCV